MNNSSCHTGNKQHLNITACLSLCGLLLICFRSQNVSSRNQNSDSQVTKIPSRIGHNKCSAVKISLHGLDFDDVRVTDMRLQTTGEGKLEPTNAGCRCHAQY